MWLDSRHVSPSETHGIGKLVRCTKICCGKLMSEADKKKLREFFFHPFRHVQRRADEIFPLILTGFGDLIERKEKHHRSSLKNQDCWWGKREKSPKETAKSPLSFHRNVQPNQLRFWLLLHVVLVVSQAFPHDEALSTVPRALIFGSTQVLGFSQTCGSPHWNPRLSANSKLRVT